MTRIHFRLDDIVPGLYIKQTVFINGRNCGQLTMSDGDYQLVGTMMLLGADHFKRHGIHIEVIEDKPAWNAAGEFVMPTDPAAVRQ